jgi:hypothetical protein
VAAPFDSRLALPYQWQKVQGTATIVVDRLKQSLEELEPPTCPSCRIVMRWTRSTLVAQDPITITHLFACPNCHQLAESKSSVRTHIIPPGKLSAPQHLRAA